jgi:hypothetical protein
VKITQQQVNAVGGKLADADFDWFLLQIIDPDLGCSILEARIPGEWHEEIHKLLGNAAGERWAERTWALPPDTVARLSEIIGFQVPEGGFEALLTPRVRRQSRPRSDVIGARASSGFPRAPGFALFLLMEDRIPFAIFTGREGDTNFEDVRKRIVALQEEGLLLSSCRTVGSEVIARYDRGTHDQSTFAPRLMGWRYHYDGDEEDDIDQHEEHVLPRNNPPLPAHKIETSQLKSEHQKGRRDPASDRVLRAVRLPRISYEELSVARPGQGWRIEAYRHVLDEEVRDGWRPDLERRAAWLLGFSEEETEKRLERERIWREFDEIEREQIREWRKEMWALVRLYGPLVGLCLLFIASLFLTDQGRDLLVSSQVSFTGGIGLAIALNLLCVVAGAAWATLIDVLEPSETMDSMTSELQSSSDTAHSRLKKDSFTERSFAWLFPSTNARLVALIFPSIIAVVLLIWHSASVALVALLAGPVLMAGLLPRVAKLFRSTRPWWGIGLALAAIIAVAFSPASVGIYLGSALTMAVLVSLWISVVVFVTHLRRKSFSIGALVVAMALAGWLKLLFMGFGSDQRDFIRTVRGADVSHPWKLQSLADMAQDAASRQSGRPQIVLVAAAGGGVRAAYWTSLLLSRATKPTGGMRDKLIMASGVSGGSLGLAVYRGLLQDNPPDCGVSPHETPLVNCVENFFANDFLAPPLAATLSGRLLNMILPLSPFPRQNEALENGWESGWRTLLPSGSKAADAFAKPFLDLWGPNGWGRPALVLNATALSSGNRLISSGVTIDGWFHPQGKCRANIAEQIPLPLSAAAGASARFPFLSELGWFEPSKQTGCEELEAVGDGGYFDNFGATTISEALHHLKSREAEPPYVIVIQITSDPDCEIRRLDPEDLPEPEGCRPKKTITPPDGRIWRWQTWKDSFNYMKASFETFPYSPNVKTKPGDAGPLDLLLRARSAYGMGMAQQLRRQVLCDFKGSYYHFSLAGTTRVPLGWTLSQRSRIEIESLLTSGPNAMELERLLQQLETGSTLPMHNKTCMS